MTHLTSERVADRLPTTSDIKRGIKMTVISCRFRGHPGPPSYKIVSSSNFDFKLKNKITTFSRMRRRNLTTQRCSPGLIQPSHMTRSVIRVRLLFHIDFFEISIILRIPKIPKEKKLSYTIFIIFHAKKY